MVTIRNERVSDVGAREALLDAAYGDVRFTKPSHKLRDGRVPAAGLSLVAIEEGRIVGTVRLWHIRAGATHDALLLGPLAVDPSCRKRGIGAALMQRALRLARMRDHGAVLLVGDACYYGRFGFSAEQTGQPVDGGPAGCRAPAGARTQARRAHGRARARSRRPARVKSSGCKRWWRHAAAGPRYALLWPCSRCHTPLKKPVKPFSPAPHLSVRCRVACFIYL